MITLPTSTPWNVQIPRVYRYLPERYIDQFFESGIIRLSTFARFATYLDEQGGDDQEGKGVLYIEGDQRSAMYSATFGSDAYILCGSTTLSQAQLDRWRIWKEPSAVLEIRNTTAFGMTIGRQLAGWRVGCEGLCEYGDRAIDRHDTSVDRLVEEMQATGSGPTLDELFQILTVHGAAFCFRKRPQFQGESEYRWIWLVDRSVSDPIEVTCLEARQYCTKHTLGVDGEWVRVGKVPR